MVEGALNKLKKEERDDSSDDDDNAPCPEELDDWFDDDGNFFGEEEARLIKAIKEQNEKVPQIILSNFVVPPTVEECERKTKAARTIQLAWRRHRVLKEEQTWRNVLEKVVMIRGGSLLLRDPSLS